MKYILLIIAICITCISCEKLLDEKSNAKLVVPSTEKDLQALLDDFPRINNAEQSCMEISTDDYYLLQADYNGIADDFKKMYRWEPNDMFETTPNDWLNAYRTVYKANTVIELIGTVSKESLSDWENIKGQAYYHRAKSYLVIAAAWCLAYDSATATTTAGIPLRTNTNFNETSVRASLQATFNLIESDIRAAITLLPLTPVHVMRPSKPAAYGLMARTLLYMRRYHDAGLYADSVLQLKNTLINFNTLNANATYPIPQFNVEVLMETRFGSSVLLNSRAKIDSNLFASYAANDLRRTVFFRNNNNGTYGFKGSYEGGATFFTGIAVNEMYITKAECLARENRIAEAMATLNTLMEKRWRNGFFVPFTAATQNEAIQLILTERRKELLMRSLRWMDIKRLNKEAAGITMKRQLNNSIIELPPNDLRYALPIPEDVIALSGIPQNPR